MTENKYLYGIIDFSYILSRNVFANSIGKKIGEYTEGDVMKTTIQSLNKLGRDYGITCDKLIFINDQWSKEFNGYYRTWLLKDKVPYKGSRKYMTWDLFNEIKNNPNSTEEEINKAELELYQNQIKYRSKSGIINDFKNLGIICIGVDGWEADDLAWLSACMLYGKDEGKPSILITQDSDQQYCTTPQMDFFKLPTKKSEPKIITYSEMYNTIPQNLRACGLSLYDYHAMSDSLGKGHNDLAKTGKTGIRYDNAIYNILNDDFSDVNDKELYELQMKTFDISCFPGFNDAQRMIMTQFNTDGHIGSIEEFHSFCDKYKITGITDQYYSGFISRFDQKLFSN